MNLTILVVISIITLFTLFIILRSVTPLQICALCGSVSVAWLTLLILLYSGYPIDPVLIGILMGGSVVGLVNLLEDKLPESYHLFKLPVYLSLLSLAYFVLGGAGLYYVVIALGLLWILTLILYIYQNSSRLKNLTQKIIQCCKNW